MIIRNKKTLAKTEFGDWQTPYELAQDICSLVAKRITPGLVVEPNCGRGAFLRAATKAFPQVERFLGIDINPDYVKEAQSIENKFLEIIKGDFFTFDLKQYMGDFSDSILLIGNPPWVTNAELMRIGSLNVPEKSNINGISGIDAITGKSNFDISEWMLIKEVESLQGKDALLAMLCKTAIARKVITYAWKNNLFFANAEIRAIDASLHFGVSVDASLLIIRFHPDYDDGENPCHVFSSLDTKDPSHVLGIRNGKIVSRVEVVDKYSMLIDEKQSAFCWRSGIKHDCSKVMELKITPEGNLINGFDERIDIEDDLLFPMLKSSDLAKGKADQIRRLMIVPQNAIGSETKSIALMHPKTWDYLNSHRTLFENRKSAIYRGKPKFSIFGVGDYTFEPWKLAISGLYKILKFTVLGPYNGKPIVFDDTCYFLAFKTKEEALFAKDLLESKVCSDILESFIFWDSKRPITKDVLSLIDLPKAAEFLGHQEEFRKTFPHLHSKVQLSLF